MRNMEEYLEQYEKSKHIIDTHTKILEKCKEKIKHHLRKNQETQYEGHGWKVGLRTMHRTTIQKKDVPIDLWERYSTTTPYETLSIKKK